MPGSILRQTISYLYFCMTTNIKMYYGNEFPDQNHLGQKVIFMLTTITIIINIKAILVITLSSQSLRKILQQRADQSFPWYIRFFNLKCEWLKK